MATPTNGHKIKFQYVAEFSSITTWDADTVYFIADTQQLYAGTQLIAGVTTTDLSAYKVKDVTISGTGNDIVGATFNASTGVLTLTKGNFPTLSKGTDTTGTAKTLTFGGTFSAMTDTAVSSHTITDENTTFTMPSITSSDLPNLTPSVTVTKESEGNVGVVVTVNGNSSTKATAQIMTPGNYVAKSGDTMTGALTLSGDPTADLQAATKQYVDSAVSGLSGAMHFIGVSTTSISDGGTETPTVDGETVTKVVGDVVLYGNKEFVWTGSAWELLGDEGSYALKTVTITAGSGLTGGGDLSANRTISHSDTSTLSGAQGGTADVTTSGSESIHAIGSVTVDGFGHVTAVSEKNIASAVKSTITNEINKLDVSAISGDYITSVSETNGKISASAGTKGSIASGNTGLVDGGSVYTAIQTALSEAAVYWTVT